MMECENCGFRIVEHVRSCPACQNDCGFPNVRMAQYEDEVDALKERYNNAWVSARARKNVGVLRLFEKELKSSKAVICKNLSMVLDLVSSDNIMYTTFYKQVGAQSRLPEENQWDKVRSSIDEAFFPYFSKEIVFASLSLNERGTSKYGEYNIILNEKMIKDRATVFEENTYLFCKKHHIALGSDIPKGYRAIWDEREKCGVAKLHHKLSNGTTMEKFPEILLSSVGSDEDDFIEVHVYGGIHRSAIEKIIGPKPTKRERAIFSSIENKLKEIGAVFEELT